MIFTQKGCALGLILKVRVFGTRKWPIDMAEMAYNSFILLHGKFLQFDWLRAVVFQLNLKYLHVKITNLLRVVV